MKNYRRLVSAVLCAILVLAMVTPIQASAVSKKSVKKSYEKLYDWLVANGEYEGQADIYTYCYQEEGGNQVNISMPRTKDIIHINYSDLDGGYPSTDAGIHLELANYKKASIDGIYACGAEIGWVSTDDTVVKLSKIKKTPKIKFTNVKSRLLTAEDLQKPLNKRLKQTLNIFNKKVVKPAGLKMADLGFVKYK
jgi:hypothetical protein